MENVTPQSTGSSSSAKPRRTPLQRLLRRLALIAGIAVASLYLLGVAGGYVWLRYSRKVDDVSLFDVAFLRVKEVRRHVAAKLFKDAKRDWDAKKFQAAFVSYSAAMARDPENVEGRLEAARFLSTLGATNLVINILEEGLALTPDDKRLNEVLFVSLNALGRGKHVLELLHGKYAAGLNGPNATFLRSAELQATLTTSGAPAALALLNRYADLERVSDFWPLIARVRWEAGEKKEAIELMQKCVTAHPELLEVRVILAGWQKDAGDVEGSIKTAMQAAEKFGSEPQARILVLDTGASKIYGTPLWHREIALYLKDFASRSDAIARLAELAGKRGWVDLTRSLYNLGSLRGLNLYSLGLFHADALARQGFYKESREVLEQLDMQLVDGGSSFMQQLRVRQIAVSLGLKETDSVREYARRLASLVRDDNDALERYRSYYLALGAKEVVAEFEEKKLRAPAKTPAAAEKKSS